MRTQRTAVARRNVALAPRAHFVRQLLAACLSYSREHLEHRVGSARPQVDGNAARLVLELLDRGNVPESQINDMNVTAWAREECTARKLLVHR